MTPSDSSLNLFNNGGGLALGDMYSGISNEAVKRSLVSSDSSKKISQPSSSGFRPLEKPSSTYIFSKLFRSNGSHTTNSNSTPQEVELRKTLNIINTKFAYIDQDAKLGKDAPVGKSEAENICKKYPNLKIEDVQDFQDKIKQLRGVVSGTFAEAANSDNPSEKTISGYRSLLNEHKIVNESYAKIYNACKENNSDFSSKQDMPREIVEAYKESRKLTYLVHQEINKAYPKLLDSNIELIDSGDNTDTALNLDRSIDDLKKLNRNGSSERFGQKKNEIIALLEEFKKAAANKKKNKIEGKDKVEGRSKESVLSNLRNGCSGLNPKNAGKITNYHRNSNEAFFHRTTEILNKLQTHCELEFINEHKESVFKKVPKDSATNYFIVSDLRQKLTENILKLDKAKTKMGAKSNKSKFKPLAYNFYNKLKEFRMAEKRGDRTLLGEISSELNGLVTELEGKIHSAFNPLKSTSNSKKEFYNIASNVVKLINKEVSISSAKEKKVSVSIIERNNSNLNEAKSNVLSRESSKTLIDESKNTQYETKGGDYNGQSPTRNSFSSGVGEIDEESLSEQFTVPLNAKSMQTTAGLNDIVSKVSFNEDESFSTNSLSNFIKSSKTNRISTNPEKSLPRFLGNSGNGLDDESVLFERTMYSSDSSLGADYNNSTQDILNNMKLAQEKADKIEENKNRVLEDLESKLKSVKVQVEDGIKRKELQQEIKELNNQNQKSLIKQCEELIATMDISDKDKSDEAFYDKFNQIVRSLASIENLLSDPELDNLEVESEEFKNHYLENDSISIEYKHKIITDLFGDYSSDKKDKGIVDRLSDQGVTKRMPSNISDNIDIYELKRRFEENWENYSSDEEEASNKSNNSLGREKSIILQREEKLSDNTITKEMDSEELNSDLPLNS